jgi:hypothetical protein
METPVTKIESLRLNNIHHQLSRKTYPSVKCRYLKYYSSKRLLQPPYDAGVPQGSVLGLLLYVQYPADLPTSIESITATFAMILQY